MATSRTSPTDHDMHAQLYARIPFPLSNGLLHWQRCKPGFLPPLHLRSHLCNQLIQIFRRLSRQSKKWFLVRQTVMTVGSLERRNGIIRANLKFLNEDLLCRRCEERGREECAYDSIEVDSAPDQERGRERQQDEGCCCEGECELSREPGKNVVIDFRFCRLTRFGVEKERTEIASAIYVLLVESNFVQRNTHFWRPSGQMKLG